jgi:hypothetical protein
LDSFVVTTPSRYIAGAASPPPTGSGDGTGGANDPTGGTGGAVGFGMGAGAPTIFWGLLLLYVLFKKTL